MVSIDLLGFLIFIYIVYFLINIINYCIQKQNINKLKIEARHIYNQLIYLNIPRYNQSHGVLHFQANEAVSNPSPEFNELLRRYKVWSYKSNDYNKSKTYSGTGAGELYSNLENFIDLADEYCREFFKSIIPKTIVLPSTLLAYVGLPKNWFTKLVDTCSGLLTIYSFFKTIVEPTIYYIINK